MSNTIILKKSSVGGKVPLATDLQVGELAVNLADARLYSKNAGGTVLNLTPVQSVAGKTGAVTLVKADVGLGNVDNTADANKSVASAAQLTTARTINGVSFNGTANITVVDSTRLPLAGGTMTGAITFAAGQTWPTFNQNTTGSAATLTTARTLTIGNTGKTFNGSADVSWTLAEIGAVGAGAGGAIIENTNTISANYTMTSGRNGTSAGPITIASGVVVTIPSGSNWAIV